MEEDKARVEEDKARVEEDKARAEEDKGARPFCTAPTTGTEGWGTRPWLFTPRAEPAISFGGPVAEETSNLYYTFGMANDEEPVEKALMASSLAAITSEDSVHRNLVTLMVDSGASVHNFDDAIVRDLKQRLQDYVHLTTPRKIFVSKVAILDGTVEGMLQSLVTDDNGNQILVRVNIVEVPEIGYNLFSVMTAAKKGIVNIFNDENPMLKRIDIAVPLQSQSGDLYSFVLDLSADRYRAKELAMNAVTNAQVKHRRLDHLYAQPFQLDYGDLIGSFMPGAIGGYKYVDKGGEYTGE